MEKKTIHLIGNAHLDPVWLWRFGDGLSEIKATFRSALDRIKEFDEFVFTSACAFYYKWVEENCPEMFEEIKKAVADGKWSIVGGMWIQPDCNMPSSESFARHFLYSQNYFYEKFGVMAKTGYNVDSFGHSAGLPTLLKEGGIDNYVYMRPDNGAEKKYPFSDSAFRWRHGEDEVFTFHLDRPYCTRELSEDEIKINEEISSRAPTNIMMFYGVGNHGGGPTIKQIKMLMDWRTHSEQEYVFSDPDRYFKSLLEDGKYEASPLYVGELQNHASGCYAANSEIKMLNRKSESVLAEAEVMSSLAGEIAGYVTDNESLREAWQTLLFNQFHDIICGCSIKAAYPDAYAYLGGAIGAGQKEMYSAADRMSWAIDTSKGVTSVSKDGGSILWEKDSLGTPVVVFNPLAHKVKVPVIVAAHTCASVTDSNENPVPFQYIESEYDRVSPTGMKAVRFFAEIEPLGYSTYWVYETKVIERVPSNDMIAEEHRLANSKVEVLFDSEKGCVKSIRTRDGKELVGGLLSRAIVIDDSENDTWSHEHFVFDQVIGEFAEPEFYVVDNGECQVSLYVKTKYSMSTLEQIFTLYADDDRLHVHTRLTLNDKLVSVKLCFDSGLENAEWVREVPGGVLTCEADGREEPTLRYMIMKEGDRGVAVVNNGKYSTSAKDGEMRFVAARTCYYADHSGERKPLHAIQDIGENEFRYVVMAYNGDTTPVAHTAEELHSEFVTVNETYHKGALPTKASHWRCDAENVSILAYKDAEDGAGKIIRLSETAGRATKCEAELVGVRIDVELSPYGIVSYRINNGKVTPCDFTERNK